MKKIGEQVLAHQHQIFIASAISVFSFIGFASSAFATAPPTLSLSATGSGDNVELHTIGDPNASVLLYYTKPGSGLQIAPLGTTNSSGSFSITISSASYGITSGTPVQVIVNGTGGPKSPVVAWPTIASSYVNSFSLSQTGLVLSVGQSANITATNAGSSPLYVSNNSNPSIANVNINGNQITITGNIYGSTSVTLCMVGTTANCPSVYVTVQNSGATQLSFSQNNVSIVAGQNLPVTINGGSGVYTLVNNSDPATVQASITGSVMTMSTGSTSGSSTLTVCSTDRGACGVVTVTVESASSVQLTFSNSLPTVSVGQSTIVNIYGPSGSVFYVSSNSNPSVVQANVSGSVLTLTGIAGGSSTISICSSVGSCKPLTATVNYLATNGRITLSQNTLSLMAGKNMNVTISGGTPPYFVSGGSSTVTQETVSGNTLTVYGIAIGTSSVNVCSAGGGCTNLAITVNSSGASPSILFAASQSTAAQTTPLPPTTSIPTPWLFTEYLAIGSQNSQVTALQQLLMDKGYFNGSITGYYGPLTEKAVRKFQAAQGITQLGVVGPATQAALNQIGNTSNTPVTASIANMTLDQLRNSVQSLQIQLAHMLARISDLTGR